MTQIIVPVIICLNCRSVYHNTVCIQLQFYFLRTCSFVIVFIIPDYASGNMNSFLGCMSKIYCSTLYFTAVPSGWSQRNSFNLIFKVCSPVVVGSFKNYISFFFGFRPFFGKSYRKPCRSRPVRIISVIPDCTNTAAVRSFPYSSKGNIIRHGKGIIRIIAFVISCFPVLEIIAVRIRIIIYTLRHCYRRVFQYRIYLRCRIIFT